MSPLEYLRKHCIISKRRMAHCNKIFLKQDKDKDAQINREVIMHLKFLPGRGVLIIIFSFVLLPQ